MELFDTIANLSCFLFPVIVKLQCILYHTKETIEIGCSEWGSMHVND